MVCRHAIGDRSCTSQYPNYSAPEPTTPDAENYTILDAYPHGKHLVLKVQYPNCKNCSYEGTKVLVFLNVSAVDALKWKRIDPHFRDPKTNGFPNSAPSPVARFPASSQGWEDALAYVKTKP